MNAEWMMFYNVENLFPPDSEDADLPNSGFRNWDDYKYNLKIRQLNKVFRFMEEDYGQLPSIIALAEIGARSVLDQFQNLGRKIKINNFEGC